MGAPSFKRQAASQSAAPLRALAPQAFKPSYPFIDFTIGLVYRRLLPRSLPVLKFIRRNATGAWVKIIFVAIVVVFIFWGVGGGCRGREDRIVVAQRERRRHRADGLLPRVQQLCVGSTRTSTSDNFKPEMVKMLDLKGRPVDQLIRASLLRQEAQRLGLRVSETEVRDADRRDPVFQQDGRFNKELYMRVLRCQQPHARRVRRSRRRRASRHQDPGPDLLGGQHRGRDRRDDTSSKTRR